MSLRGLTLVRRGLARILRQPVGAVLGLLVLIAALATTLGVTNLFALVNSRIDAEHRARLAAESKLRELTAELDKLRDAAQRVPQAASSTDHDKADVPPIADQQTLLDRLRYISHISLAQRRWEHNDIQGAWEALNLCKEHLRGWEYDYLYTLFTLGHKTLTGHPGRIECVAISPDGRRVAAGSEDHRVTIWDVATGQITRTRKGSTKHLNSLAFSPDSQRIYSECWDGKGEVWNAESGEFVRAFTSLSEVIENVAFSSQGKCVSRNCRTYSPDRQWFLSGGHGNSAQLFNATNPTTPLNLENHATRCACFTPDGQQIVGADWKNEFALMDAESGKIKVAFRGHLNTVSGLAVSPDGERIASGSHDKMVKIWNLAAGQEQMNLKGHQNFVNSVAYSPDGKWIASGSFDKTVKLWDAERGQAPCVFADTATVWSLCFSPDGKRVVSGGNFNTVRVWDLESRSAGVALEKYQPTSPNGGVTTVFVSAVFSPDGKWIAAGTPDNAVTIWDSHDGKLARSLKGHSQEVVAVRFTPDGKRLLSGSHDRSIKIWDFETGDELLTVTNHTDQVRNITISPDGRQVASGGDDNCVRIWDLESGRETAKLTEHPGFVIVAFSPDGTRLATGASRYGVRIWDVATNRHELTLEGTTNVWSISYSPDGKRIAGGCNDGTVTLWDAQHGNQMLALNGHPRYLRSVAFSPDGKQIASGGEEGNVVIWDARGPAGFVSAEAP